MLQPSGFGCKRKQLVALTGLVTEGIFSNKKDTPNGNARRHFINIYSFCEHLSTCR